MGGWTAWRAIARQAQAVAAGTAYEDGAPRPEAAVAVSRTT